MSRYFDDFEVGQEFTTLGRTIAESDLLLFAGMTGDNSALHTDEEYSKKSIYGQRLVHGILVISIGLGLISRTLIFEGTGVAFLGMDGVLFLKPIFVGDTVTAKFTIRSMRDTKKPDRGVVVRHVVLYNQRAEAVLEFSISGLVLKRAQALGTNDTWS